ncbi:hypothetical protein GQ457_17G010740 [Hibiscus cannabinus]
MGPNRGCIPAASNDRSVAVHRWMAPISRYLARAVEYYVLTVGIRHRWLRPPATIRPKWVPWSVSGQLARIRIHVLTWPLGRYGREVLPAGSVVMHHTRFKHRTRGVAKWTQRARNVHLRGSHGAYRSELGLDRAMGRWVIELGLRV